MLASLDGQHSLGSAVGLHTLKPQHNFLCGFSLKKNNNIWLTLISQCCTCYQVKQQYNTQHTFFRKMGFVWPPYPLCFLSYLLLPAEHIQFNYLWYSSFITDRPFINGGLFTLCIEGILSLLVLGNFVGLVLLALLAVRPAGLRDVHLNKEGNKI